MAKDTQITIRINSDLKQAAKQHAAETGRTLAGLIEWLVRQELKKADSLKRGGQGREILKMNKVLKGIMKVAQETTDFESGFDRLFGFMAENPESRTTKDFISFHIIEMNSPSIESGEPEFTYLIGKDFIADHWVDEEDFDKFQKFCEAQMPSVMSRDE